MSVDDIVNLKTAKYTGVDGKEFSVTYDPQASCLSCGQPVISASMGGTAICSWCDCGKYRDGSEWSVGDALDPEQRRAKARAIQIQSQT